MRTMLFCLLFVTAASGPAGASAMAAGPESAQPVSPADAAPVAVAGDEDLPAVLRGKYGQLLKKIAVPQDLQGYGEVRVYGWWGGTAYAGYQDLPPGYWVYLYPDWHIFDGPPGMVSPYVSKEERALFSECQDKEKAPDSLIKAWAAFAKVARQGEARTLRTMCLPHSVEVTENGPPAEAGTLRLSGLWLKTRFDARVLLARRDSDSCVLLRTGQMAFWFVETASEGWKLYRVVVKDLE